MNNKRSPPDSKDMSKQKKVNISCEYRKIWVTCAGERNKSLPRALTQKWDLIIQNVHSLSISWCEYLWLIMFQNILNFMNTLLSLVHTLCPVGVDGVSNYWTKQWPNISMTSFIRVLISYYLAQYQYDVIHKDVNQLLSRPISVWRHS